MEVKLWNFWDFASIFALHWWGTCRDSVLEWDRIGFMLSWDWFSEVSSCYFLLAQKVTKKGSPSEAPASTQAHPKGQTCRPLRIFSLTHKKAIPFAKKSAGGLVAQANRLPFLRALLASLSRSGPRDTSSLRFRKPSPDAANRF
jgi:hypothetical protein